MLDNDSSFYQQIKDSKKILVLDLGFLGDTIHLIPALACIRKAMPDAELHVVVAQHVMSIMQVLPWVDKVLGYPRFPKGPRFYQDWGRIKKLRAEKYDCVINLNGSQRSIILTGAIGAPFRLGRIQPRPFILRKLCLTHAVDVPFGTMPMYQQRWECLKQSGFPGESMEFPITIPQHVEDKISKIIGKASKIIHISPFTTEDYREMPAPMLTQHINRINQELPEYRIAISCAPNEREQTKLINLLTQIDFQPWKTFPGSLNLVELTALIKHAKLHLGGDSGGLHVALMAGAPTLSWFKNSPVKVEWLPQGNKHKHVIGQATPKGLQGIDTEQFWNYTRELLQY